MAEQTTQPTPTSSIRATANEAPFLAVLDKQRRFQAQWRRLMMGLYVGTTVGTILATAGATLVAALQYARWAAMLAGLGTVLVSLEKSLLFRERWRLHIKIETLLEGVDVDYRTGRISLEQATASYQSVMADYAEQVPVRSREPE